MRKVDSVTSAPALLADADIFTLAAEDAPGVRVTLHVSGSSFSWAFVDGDGSEAEAPPASDVFAAAWEACWSCAAQPAAGTEAGLAAAAEERTALGPGRSAGGRLDLADVLGGEARAEPEAALLVTYADRSGATKADAHRWRIRTLRFVAPAAAAAKKVADLLRATLRGPAFRCRPRQLLVIVTPASGKGRGPDTWARKAAPVLAAANVACRVVHTTRPGDAHDVARQLAARVAEAARTATPGGAASPPPLPPLARPGARHSTSPRPAALPAAAVAPLAHAGALDAGPADVDGVLVVGGDGTFNEVLNGLMSRPDWGRLAASRLRFGVIPAGSTDAVACTLHGTRCARTAAAHAALGGAQPMDALRLDAADGTLRWASNFAGYGFYGDVISMSEYMRWMGPARYGVSGALAYLRHVCYGGSVEYLPAEGQQGGASGVGVASPPAPEEDGARGTPLLRRRRAADMLSPKSTPTSMGSVGGSKGRLSTTSLSPGTGDSADSLVDDDDADACPDGDSAPMGARPLSPAPGDAGSEAPDAPLRPLERATTYPPRTAKRALMPLGAGAAGEQAAAAPASAGAAPPAPGWRQLQGPFHVVACAAISCRNDAAPHGIAPRAALADGCADLIAVRPCSRPAYLRHLLRLSNPWLGDHLELPFVTAVKARAVRFTPAPGQAASRWNCDGELLPPSAAKLQVTVEPRLLTMLAFVPDDVK